MIFLLVIFFIPWEKKYAGMKIFLYIIRAIVIIYIIYLKIKFYSGAVKPFLWHPDYSETKEEDEEEEVEDEDRQPMKMPNKYQMTEMTVGGWKILMDRSAIVEYYGKRDIIDNKLSETYNQIKHLINKSGQPKIVFFGKNSPFLKSQVTTQQSNILSGISKYGFFVSSYYPEWKTEKIIYIEGVDNVLKYGILRPYIFYFFRNMTEEERKIMEDAKETFMVTMPEFVTVQNTDLKMLKSWNFARTSKTGLDFIANIITIFYTKKTLVVIGDDENCCALQDIKDILLDDLKLLRTIPISELRDKKDSNKEARKLLSTAGCSAGLPSCKEIVDLITTMTDEQILETYFMPYPGNKEELLENDWGVTIVESLKKLGIIQIKENFETINNDWRKAVFLLIK